MKSANNSAAYRAQLLQMSQDVTKHASSVEEQTCVPTGGQADGGLSNTPMHLADIGTDVSLQETASVVLDNERYLLSEIDSALQRLDSGQYGVCESCGDTINEERLEAVPYTRYCIDCARAVEEEPAANINTGRSSGRFALQQKLIERPESSGERVLTAEVPADNSSGDPYGAGTAGGGTAIGGLAGTNVGHGDPRGGELERATANGTFDADDGEQDDELKPLSGRSGGSIGGTPNGKRTTDHLHKDPVQHKPPRRPK